MDIEKLRSLSQEGQNNLENKVLEFCNPQEIAKEIMSNLETNAAEKAKEGKHEAKTWFTIWEKYHYHSKMEKTTTVDTRGPLVSCDNKEELSNVLFNMVRKYIDDDNIQLKLETVYDPAEDEWCKGLTEGANLGATISW